MNVRNSRSRDAPEKTEAEKPINDKEVLMKKKEAEALIMGLRNLSAELANIAEALEGKAEPEAAPAKEETKTYTFEEVRLLLADKARSGFRAEVKAILTAHGAGKLSDITDPAELAAIASEAEAVGNG